MEKESVTSTISESEFLDLLSNAKKGDKEAMLELIHFFEEEIFHIARFIRLPKEDAQQSIITQMIELFLNEDIE